MVIPNWLKLEDFTNADVYGKTMCTTCAKLIVGLQLPELCGNFCKLAEICIAEIIHKQEGLQFYNMMGLDNIQKLSNITLKIRLTSNKVISCRPPYN